MIFIVTLPRGSNRQTVQFRKMDFNEVTTTNLVALHPGSKKALGVKITNWEETGRRRGKCKDTERNELNIH